MTGDVFLGDTLGKESEQSMMVFAELKDKKGRVKRNFGWKLWGRDLNRIL